MAEYARWRSRPSGEPLKTEPIVIPNDLTTIIESGQRLVEGRQARDIAIALGLPLTAPNGARREELEGRTVLLRIELIHDSRYGPFLRGSLSGVAFDLFGATSLRALPQTNQDVEEFITSIPGITITDGYAKLPVIDRTPLIALTKTLVGIADQLYTINAMLLDPISLTTKGLYLHGVRLLLRDSPLEPQMVTRSLRAPGSIH
jgi:hypothetical protein